MLDDLDIAEGQQECDICGEYIEENEGGDCDECSNLFCDCCGQFYEPTKQWLCDKCIQEKEREAQRP